MDQQGRMSLGLNIRLALVYLALTAICVCCGEPQASSYVFKGFPQSSLQALQRMRRPDSAEDPMELSPSEEWMAGSDWVQRETDRPAPQSLAHGRPQLLGQSSSYFQSGGPSTQTAIRQPSHSLQSSPGSTDPGAVTVVRSSHKPVQSQFGYWSTNPVESGAARESDPARMIAVGEGVSIMRQKADQQNSPSVVSSSAINFLGSSAHSRQASASVQQAHRLGAGDGATVSTSIAEQPFEEGRAQYVKIKLHKRPNWAPHPLTAHHESQGQSLASVVSSSSHVQHGQVNTPVESRHEQAPQSNRNVQSVSSRDGYGLDKPKTWEQGEPVQSRYRPYKVIHSSNSLAMGQPSDAGSSVPEGHQGLKNADPQMVARPDGLFDQHRSAGDVRKTTRVKPQYSSSSAKPGWNTNVKTSREPQGFIEYSKSPVQTKYSRVHAGAIQSSGQKEQPQKGAGLAAIVTGNADFGPKFGRLSSVSSLSGGFAQSQGVGKSIRIETRRGYVDVPMVYRPRPDYFGADGKSSSRSGPRLNPDILKRLSELDQNVARLAQTKGSTSSYVVGTRIQLPASSPKARPGKPRNPRKFKPVGLADIGGSVVIKPRKRIRSAPESDDYAALPYPDYVSTLQSTGKFPAEQESPEEHPEESLKAQQSSSHDIMNIHSRFTPRSGSQDKGRPWDAGNQRMEKSANSERNGEFGRSSSTKDSIAPSVSQEKRVVESDETVPLDPRAAHLIQRAKSTSSFVAGRHVLKSRGRVLFKQFPTPEPLQQDMAIMNLKPLRVSDVGDSKLSAGKAVYGLLSDVNDNVDHV